MTVCIKNKRLLRLISMGLIICICLTVIMAPKAYAISGLVIVGTIALTLGVAAAITVIVASANGSSEALSNAAAAGLQGQAEFTEFLLRSYSNYKNMQITYLLSAFAAGAKLTHDGKLILDNALSDLLTDFFDWAWDNELKAFATVDSIMTVNPSTIPDFPITINANLMYYDGIAQVPIQNPSTIYSSLKPFGLVNISSRTYMYFFSFEPFTITKYDINNGTTTTINTNFTTSKTVNGTTYTYYYSPRYVYSNTNTPDLWSQSTFDSISAFNMAYTYYHAGDYMQGGDEEPTYEEDALVLPAPQTGSNVLDIPGALNLPAPIDGTTTADNYLVGAADAIITGTGTIEYEDANAVTQTGTLQGTGTVGLTQVRAESAELEDTIEIADGVGSPTLDNYTLDLTKFFPFCIPFDLHDMLELLKSSPAPVSVTWVFDFGDLGDYSMIIDLQDFNMIAQTLRTMELLSFCFGLALATRKLLMGS